MPFPPIVMLSWCPDLKAACWISYSEPLKKGRKITVQLWGSREAQSAENGFARLHSEALLTVGSYICWHKHDLECRHAGRSSSTHTVCRHTFFPVDKHECNMCAHVYSCVWGCSHICHRGKTLSARTHADRQTWKDLHGHASTKKVRRMGESGAVRYHKGTPIAWQGRETNLEFSLHLL